MSSPGREQCPICNSVQAHTDDRSGDWTKFSCSRCGEYILIGTATATIGPALNDEPKRRAILSYAVRRMSCSKPTPRIGNAVIEHVLSSVTLPKPAEQASNLILWL